ncbi:hypothetical protein MHEC_28720 [Mycobacterium heckeshornense]|uniref:Transposase n=1 Tax=Mycobacterium heckeshornense TaxID=110505 RepID=A0A7R7GUS1_9MYCO|nr:hypothetical protein MHEC_28720 [Mycobacterium heckeshornense]
MTSTAVGPTTTSKTGSTTQTRRSTLLSARGLQITIESINFQLRKITKNRGHFPDKDSAIKLLYLGLRNISSHRGGYSGTGTYNWTVALNTLAKLFPGRIPLC